LLGAAFWLLLLSWNRRQEIRGVIGAFLLDLSLEGLQHLIYRNPTESRNASVRDNTLAAFALYRLAGAAACFRSHAFRRCPRQGSGHEVPCRGQRAPRRDQLNLTRAAHRLAACR
jgi:hypothetical protein